MTDAAITRSVPLVRLEVSDRVATLTMTSPANFNALSSAMLSALQLAVDEVSRNEHLRVLVIAAEGRAFSAGHDMREMNTMSRDEHAALFAQCNRFMLSLLALPVAVIARVHAMATAAGCQLVANCDLAIAADGARFAVSGINYGIFCGTPSVPLLRNVPRKIAFEMLMTGEFIDAQSAQARGLVNHVVAEEALDAEVARMAQAIAAKPRDVVAAGKALFYRQAEMGVAAAYQLAGESMVCNLQAPSGQEGMTAFSEKRKPVF